MIDRLPFIEHQQAKLAFERLNSIVRLKGLGIMEASRATGKTRILEEFITHQLKGAAPDRTVLVTLQQTYRKTLLNEDSERIGSPITLWLFDQLHYILQRLSLPIHTGQKKLVQVPATRIHTERAFSVLYRKVFQEMQTQRTRVVVIDNAQHLDAFALEWLLALRETLTPQIAVIFCAQLQPDEQSSHTLNLALSNVGAASDSLVDRFQLAELSFEDFSAKVFNPFLVALQLQLTDTYNNDPVQFIALVTTLWSWTMGNWVLLDRVGRLLLAEYADITPPYQLTPAVISRVERTLKRITAKDPVLI